MLRITYRIIQGKRGGGKGGKGGGQSVHGQTEPTQRAPIVARREAEKVGLKDQSCARQGRLSKALPRPEPDGTASNVAPNYHHVHTGHREDQSRNEVMDQGNQGYGPGHLYEGTI